MNRRQEPKVDRRMRSEATRRAASRTGAVERSFVLAGLIGVMLLAGCDEPVGEEPGLVWDPLLNDSGSGGVLDLGVVAPTQSVSGQITVRNDTEEDVLIEVTCNLTGGGWIITCPVGERTLPPTQYDEDTGDPLQGTFLSVGPRFQSGAEADYDGTIAFEFDNRLVTYVVQVTVQEDE
jgi:hypothetical protein